MQIGQQKLVQRSSVKHAAVIQQKQIQSSTRSGLDIEGDLKPYSDEVQFESQQMEIVIEEEDDEPGEKGNR